MNLAAKLAIRQLKINRSRTIWTLIGIILSTALITAVCSFAASGNVLLINLLGKNYGNYNGLFSTLLVVPAGFLSMIIISMSVVVISNAFRISASERTAQFGILKSVGATKQQIMVTVIYESVLLSVVGIPIGIITGLILAFVGVQVANYFLSELNSLVYMMMNKLVIVIDFVIAWQALMIATVISFFTVLFSAWLPAYKAAKITAIDSIHGAGEVKIETKPIHINLFVEKLFGFEGTLAAKNIKRNKRNFRASVISLTVGIVLFINLAALSKQVSLIESMIYPDVDATVIVDYTSLRKSVVNEVTGREETIIVNPIDSKLADITTEKLRTFENTNIFGLGSDMQTYKAIIPKEIISPNMIEAIKNQYPEQPMYRFSVDIITIDSKNYALLCKQVGVPYGSNILINHYSYNDNGILTIIPPFLYDEVSELQLIQADDSIHQIPIHGVLTPDDVPNELLGINTHIVRVIVPEGKMRSYDWFANPTNIDNFIEYANMIMGEIFPCDTKYTYEELGFNTRVYKTQDYMKIMNIPIVIVTVFAYSFVALLVLIGLTNVISTISTNVLMRSREFAVLQSIGMTHSGLKHILNLESILCSAKSLIIGLPLAIILTYLINLPIRAKLPVPYQLPWFAILCCIIVVFMITWITIQYSAFQLRGKNIMETIHSESGK